MGLVQSLVTKGVKISVESFFQNDYSNARENKFIFTYKIFIENNNPYTIQLLRRHWYIFDSNGTYREVEGEGVIGLQPIIESGDAHTYVSWSQLETEIGQMNGRYQMLNLNDNTIFEVEIPCFHLIMPGRLN
ncbi:MAG: Co2+/Mg2+ efflux protein ApaG [Saprospiraceae bacterium]|jgi:ApaG protein|nr:Co2+/Mg2+ efflux protein ApaG [Saprospiraceae bacterium]